MPANSAVLCAWLYDVDQYGKSRPTWPDDRQPIKTVPSGAILHVSASADAAQDSPARRYLKAPPAEGMASEPVTVSLDEETGYWTIRNSGRTNTLRVQQYGLPAVPLRPRAAMPMAGEDVAVWIPVVPHLPGFGKTESFRLLVLAGPEKPDEPGKTQMITAPRRYLTDNKREALIAYFGDHLSWPPVPAPHVRQQAEVERIAAEYRLLKAPSRERWARNRFDVLSGRDGLFRDADWFPPLGGADRTLANHLAAFYRLVELRTITLQRVCEWVQKYDVAPYARIEKRLIP